MSEATRLVGEGASQHDPPGVRFIDGHHLFVQDEGQGTPVLLLHGAPFTHHAYRGVVGPLSAQHRTILMDLPGFGDSGRPPAFGYDPVSYADSLAKVLEELRAKPVSVVAHGYGAAIAMAMSVLRPGSVRQLVLVGATIYPQRLSLPSSFMMGDGLVAGWIRKLTFTRKRLARYLRERAFANADLADDELVDHYWEGLSREGGIEAFRRVVVATSMLDPVAELPPRVRCPTLVVWGERDQVVQPMVGRRLADEIVGSRFVMLEGSGHCPHEEQPAQFVKHVAPFLSEEG